MKLMFYAISATARDATVIAIDALNLGCVVTSGPMRSAAGVCAIKVVDVDVRDCQVLMGAALKAGAWLV